MKRHTSHLPGRIRHIRVSGKKTTHTHQNWNQKDRGPGRGGGGWGDVKGRSGIKLIPVKPTFTWQHRGVKSQRRVRRSYVLLFLGRGEVGSQKKSKKRGLSDDENS